MANMTVREWKRPDAMGIPEHLKTPGYRYKWVRKDRLAYRVDEGWEVVPVQNGKLMKENPDGVNMDKAYHLRELILCRMPEEMAKQRDAYFQKKAQEPLKEIREVAEKAIAAGANKANAASNRQHGTEGEGYTKAIGSAKVTRANPNKVDGFGVEKDE